MEKTLNKIRKELKEIADEHAQINEFFFGNYLDAISRNSAKYPLLVCIPQSGTIGDDYVDVNLQLIICDKYNESEYEQINEIYSDLLSVLNDIRITFKQMRHEEYLDVLTDTPVTPFDNRGHDLTAGWTADLSLRVYSYGDWCSIPYDSYDFGN